MVTTVIIKVGSDALWGHLARGVFTPQTRFEKKKIIMKYNYIFLKMFFLTSGLILKSYITVMFCKTTNFKTPFFLLVKISWSNVTLEHKSSLKSRGYICSKSQKYIVWVKIIIISFIYIYAFSSQVKSSHFYF